MRFARLGLLVPFLLLVTPIWAQQTTQTTTNPTSDPQAVAAVEAAITALGGATAIGQAQSWTFQAQMRGAFENDIASYVMSTDTDTGHFLLVNGVTASSPMTRSHFLPALAGLILLNQSKDPQFAIKYGGVSTLD